ncbi:hypothetical protein [Sinorhizobium fredii]|uniref:hypothetical protein n=1 Tax=Rhizobium fredii TaxID=380 RepID=UPI0009B7179F|nr:hypothetical protein [Sinorhizobium fredii]WOS64693.1 hypothetical protein SFGR64A_24255 [Sinorhizobium fredii GR64]
MRLSCMKLRGPTMALEADGLGQGFWEELRWFWRFRRSRRVPVPWRRPRTTDRDWIERHTQMRRFGDTTVAVAWLDGRRWIVKERFWFGWPDPPRYVMFVLESETVWMAKDFNRWPPQWRKPWDAA